jgi:hypothetical protein
MDIKKGVKNFLRGAYRAWNEPPKVFDYENEKVISGRLFPDQVRGALINAQDSKLEFFVRDNRILLKNMTDPEAIDELCAMAVDVKYPLAREIALQCNYEPRGLHRRVLFFYATQQWEKYDALDPDGELLRRTYTLATPDECKQIAAAGRAGGRSEIVELVAKAWQAGAKPVPKADSLSKRCWNKSGTPNSGRSHWKPPRCKAPAPCACWRKPTGSPTRPPTALCTVI